MDEIRVTDAWVMGQDNTSPDFHRALLNLLADPNPMVQRNAALSLVRFADDSGRRQIVAMLRLYEMPSPSGGVVRQRLKPGDVVNPGTMVGHINVGDRASKEVRAVVPGTLQRWTVPDGASVTQGQPILTLAPSESMVWEALRALYLVGRAEDLPDVDRFTRGAAGFSPQIAQQAQATSRAIRSHSSSYHKHSLRFTIAGESNGFSGRIQTGGFCVSTPGLRESRSPSKITNLSSLVTNHKSLPFRHLYEITACPSTI